MVEDVLLQDVNEFIGLLAKDDISFVAGNDILYMTCGLNHPLYEGLTYRKEGYKYILIDCDQKPVILRALVFHELTHGFFYEFPHSKCVGEIFSANVPTLDQAFFWDKRVRRLMNFIKSRGVIDECD